MPRLRILVVDDEPWIRSDVSRILRNFKVDYPFLDEAFEYDILEADSDETAIPLITKSNPEIIFLGKKENATFGEDLLSYIRAQSLGLFIIVIINSDTPEQAKDGSSEPAFDYIVKPFSPQELKLSVEIVTKKIFLKAVTNRMQVTGKQVRFQFLSMLSHELKAPLNAIEGYIGMVKDRHFGNDLKDYDHVFDRVIERINGMRNVVLDLLDLTRLEAGNYKKELKPVNLCQVARNAIDIMNPYSIQRDISVELDCPDDFRYSSVQEEMEIILNNLISNAIKYNKTGGHVKCSIARKDQEVEIRVTDTGIGMTPDESERLFRDFTRIRNEKTKNIPGSGLGLSIIKKLTDSYNGIIEFRSKPDSGSTFIVTLPTDKPCT